MLQRLSPAVLVFLLPFFIEGARSAIPNDPDFTPTTNPAPLPSAVPILLLTDFDEALTTCTVPNITWSYNGPSTRLTFVVTNFQISQGPPPTPSPSLASVTFSDGALVRPLQPRDPDSITITIVQDLDPSQLYFPWQVDVPSGWYSIVASMGSQLLDQTSQFFVQDGRDTSCLVGGPTASSTSSTSTSPPGTTSQAPQETASPPTPVASTSKDNHVGVIIGVVAGVVVALIVILIAFLCLRKRKQSHVRSSDNGGLPGASLRRGWGGLGSFSSIHSSRPGPTSRDLAAAAREVPRYTEEVAHRSGNSTPFSFEEKMSAAVAPDYGNPFDDNEGGITLATLPSNGRRSNSTRSSLQPSPPHYNPSIDAIVTSYDPETSIRSTDLSSSPQHSLTPVEMMPSYSNSSSSASPTERNKAKRDSTGSQSAVRKMARKPVPVYDPAVHTSSTPSPYIENASPVALTPGTPTVATSSIMGQGHYAKKSQPNASNPDGINVLNHKSSFGPGGVEGKPVHYLIPDMPLPRAN